MFKLTSKARLHSSVLLAAAALALPSLETTASDLYAGTVLIKLPLLLFALLLSSVDLDLIFPLKQLAKGWLISSATFLVIAIQLVSLYFASSNFWAYHAQAQFIVTLLDMLAKAVLLNTLFCHKALTRKTLEKPGLNYLSGLAFLLLGLSIFASEYLASKLLLDPTHTVSALMTLWRFALIFILMRYSTKQELQCIILGIIAANVCAHLSIFDLQVSAHTLAASCMLNIAILIALIYLQNKLNRESPSAQLDEEAEETSTSKLPARVLEISEAAKLSKRETEVMFADLSGKTLQEIAHDLGISTSAISTYKSRAYEKLQVANKADLLDLILELPAASKRPKVLHKRRFSLRIFLQVTAPVLMLFLLSKVLTDFLSLDAFGLIAMLCWLCYLAFAPQGTAHLSNFSDLSRMSSLFSLGFSAILLFSYQAWSLDIASSGLALINVALSISLLIVGSGPKSFSLAANSTFALLGSLIAISCLIAHLQQLYFFFILICLLIGTIWLYKTSSSFGEEELCDMVLEGSERALAYLMGRGLSEFQAHIVLLTCKGFSRTAISGKMHASIATIARQKSAALKQLGLESMLNLSELLKQETGLD